MPGKIEHEFIRCRQDGWWRCRSWPGRGHRCPDRRFPCPGCTGFTNGFRHRFQRCGILARGWRPRWGRDLRAFAEFGEKKEQQHGQRHRNPDAKPRRLCRLHDCFPSLVEEENIMPASSDSAGSSLVGTKMAAFFQPNPLPFFFMTRRMTGCRRRLIRYRETSASTSPQRGLSTSKDPNALALLPASLILSRDRYSGRFRLSPVKLEASEFRILIP